MTNTGKDLMARIKRLRVLLDDLGEGEIPRERRDEVIKRLKEIWAYIKRPDVGLDAHKLDRIEKLEWRPPELWFTIERHGALVLGSTRAELQHWRVNLETGEADYVKGYRQVYPRRKPWRTAEIHKVAYEIAQLILSGKEDDRLRWISDRKVQVLTRKIIPGYSQLPRRTSAGRLKRFYKILEDYLRDKGWVRKGSYFEKIEDNQRSDTLYGNPTIENSRP